MLEITILETKKRLLEFKNNAPFISCILKINGLLIENAENLDVAMPMYNLLEYSKNCSETSGSLWNYYRDELTNEKNDNNNPPKNLMNTKSFKYKTSITGSTCNVAATARDYISNKQGTKVKIAVPLKYLSNFWRTLDIPLINSEVSLTLTWSANCVITTIKKEEGKEIEIVLQQVQPLKQLTQNCMFQ